MLNSLTGEGKNVAIDFDYWHENKGVAHACRIRILIRFYTLPNIRKYTYTYTCVFFFIPFVFFPLNSTCVTSSHSFIPLKYLFKQWNSMALLALVHNTITLLFITNILFLVIDQTIVLNTQSRPNPC